MKLVLFIILCACSAIAASAQYDKRDTVHGMPASKFWGNSTYFSAGINLARNQEYEINIGRTYGQVHTYTRGFFTAKASTWGFGYGYSPARNGMHNLKAFYERKRAVAFPWACYAIRGEYIYNTTSQQHYLRPFFGFDISFVTFGYNYSFLLNDDNGPNLYRHGFALRLKYFAGRKNWFRTRTKGYGY
jgi:hypothetical protein